MNSLCYTRVVLQDKDGTGQLPDRLEETPAAGTRSGACSRVLPFRAASRLCCLLAFWLLLPVVAAPAVVADDVASETNSVVTTAPAVVTTSNAMGTNSTVVAASTKAVAPALQVAARSTNSTGMTGSVVRMLAGLAFVLAMFFGGVWLFKNWQRVSRVRNKSKLNVFEARSLGPRQALYVVGYNQQRFLVAASQAGISLISALPSAALEEATPPVVANGGSSFAQILQNVLLRK